jgi:Delta3-Delta2-enoyl-CoA isomerase
MLQSRGLDLSTPLTKPGSDTPRHHLQNLTITNLYLPHAYGTHSKILIVALNGPAVGGAAALVPYADFVYATPETYLLFPFASLGLVTEVGASVTVVQKLGISLANEALLMGRKIEVERLEQKEFVRKVIEAPTSDQFLGEVMDDLSDVLGDHLNGESLLRIKALINHPGREALQAQSVAEAFAGLERLASGVVAEQMRKIRSGEKKHKL